eukprot:2966308-Alexandrium_andersonii.AAC.1
MCAALLLAQPEGQLCLSPPAGAVAKQRRGRLQSTTAVRSSEARDRLRDLRWARLLLSGILPDGWA